MKLVREKEISYKEIKDIKLGADYSKNATSFRVFAPNREKIDLVITDDYKKVRRNIYPMKKDEMGIFSLVLKGDYDGYFYNYIVDDEYEVTDPYAYSASINSMYSAVINLEDTNPSGFEESNHINIDENEAIIYEMSVKNYTAEESSGVVNRGKFLGLTESGKKFAGLKTGIDNIEDLGVTHVQLLPIYDF